LLIGFAGLNLQDKDKSSTHTHTHTHTHKTLTERDILRSVIKYSRYNKTSVIFWSQWKTVISVIFTLGKKQESIWWELCAPVCRLLYR